MFPFYLLPSRPQVISHLLSQSEYVFLYVLLMQFSPSWALGHVVSILVDIFIWMSHLQFKILKQSHYFSLYPPQHVPITYLFSFLCLPSWSMALPETWVIFVISYSFLSFAIPVPVPINDQVMLGFGFRHPFSLSSALCFISPFLYNLTAALFLFRKGVFWSSLIASCLTPPQSTFLTAAIRTLQKTNMSLEPFGGTPLQYKVQTSENDSI